jgi:DNA-binding transcriptional LysR family regulator
VTTTSKLFSLARISCRASVALACRKPHEPVVLEFLTAYPEINVRLLIADYGVDLVENHVDLAVRIGPEQ